MLRYRIYILSFLAACIPALSSCTKDPDPGLFAPPQLGGVYSFCPEGTVMYE